MTDLWVILLIHRQGGFASCSETRPKNQYSKR